MEHELWIAQADDALVDIQRIRRVIVGISQFKHANVSGSGQKYNTRMQGLYDKFKGKESATAARYRAAHAALQALDADGA